MGVPPRGSDRAGARLLEVKGEPVLMMATAGRNEDGEEDAHTVVVCCSEDHRNVFIVHVP